MEQLSSDSAYLIERAKHAAMWGRSYSGTRVGAAVRTEREEIYTGANLSNASPSLTMCAERMAVQNAMAAGARELVEVAVYSPDYELVSPCGPCRQVIIEFARSAELLVWMAGESLRDGPRWQAHTIGELLPFAYVSRRTKVS